MKPTPKAKPIFKKLRQSVQMSNIIISKTVPGSMQNSHLISKVPSGSLDLVNSVSGTRSVSKQKKSLSREANCSLLQQQLQSGVLIKFVHPSSKHSLKSSTYERSLSQHNNKAQNSRKQNQVIIQQILRKEQNRDSQTNLEAPQARLFSTQAEHHGKQNIVSASFDLNL